MTSPPYLNLIMSSLGAESHRQPQSTYIYKRKKSIKITIQKQNINKKGQKLYIQKENKEREKREQIYQVRYGVHLNYQLLKTVLWEVEGASATPHLKI